MYLCPDCNLNGTPDHREFTYLYSSPFRQLGGGGSRGNRFLILPETPPAASDVFLAIAIQGDLSRESEYVTWRIGTALEGREELGRIFVTGATDCPVTPEEQRFVIPREVFNRHRSQGRVQLSFEPSEQVNTSLCGGTNRYRVFVHYAVESSTVDADGDRVPDACEGCEVPPPPKEEPGGAVKNRYVSFRPVETERIVAYRVTAVEVPPGFESLAGATRWVDVPETISEWSGCTDPVSCAEAGAPPAGTVRISSLSCEPVYAVWEANETIHVTGEMIVPGALYRIEAIDRGCDLNDPSAYSAPLFVSTARWGDVVGSCTAGMCAPPDGAVDVTTDLAAVSDKFRNVPGAIGKVRADLAGGVPNRMVDMEDVARALDAFRGAAYPFEFEERCAGGGG